MSLEDGGKRRGTFGLSSLRFVGKKSIFLCFTPLLREHAATQTSLSNLWAHREAYGTCEAP